MDIELTNISKKSNSKMRKSFDERESLYRHHNYGTCNNNSNSSKHHNFIVHQINRGDSLMSIAIRYNVTTGAIKQINNLFTNEIAFLNTLKIPVSNNTKDKPSNSAQLDQPDLIKDSVSKTESSTTSSPSTSSISNTSVGSSKFDFLQKMDEQINRAKNNLEKINEKSVIREDLYSRLTHSQSSATFREYTNQQLYPQHNSSFPTTHHNQNDEEFMPNSFDVHIKSPNSTKTTSNKPSSAYKYNSILPATQNSQAHNNQNFNSTFRDDFYDL